MVALTEVQQLQQQVAALTDRIASLESTALVQIRFHHPDLGVIPLAGENFSPDIVYTMSRSRLAEVERAIVELRRVNSWRYDALEIGLC